MGRRLFQWSALGVVTGVVFLLQPAAAGERREKAEIRAVKSESRDSAFFAKAVFSARTAVTADTTAAGRKAEPRTSAEPSRPEHKPLTFFRFRTEKLGEVSVQPVVGGVNGAQLSIGF